MTMHELASPPRAALSSRFLAFLTAAISAVVLASCSSGATGTAAGAGGSGQAGAGPGAGGNPSSGGADGTGGVTAAGGDASTGDAAGGGGTGSGGVTGAGGASASGGAQATGGSRASGGATGPDGATTAPGGATGAGGATSRGGSSGSGGAIGGATGAGGAVTGGATSAGGSTAGGGTTGTGGVVGTGGTTVSTGPALAFPGAQGFGKKATGGRNGVVYHVTNLNDSGAGSFRDAVSVANRIIVFDVGGYIQLKTAVGTKGNLTIAGQTAPGEGIGFRGGEISFANQTDIIMRHVRIRPGSETESTDDDALSLYSSGNVIIDHASLEFAPWNNIDGVGTTDDPVTDVTFQDTLVADPTGQQFGAHTESVGGNWSWYRSIFANSHNRNPLAKVNNVFVNNLLYNCSAGYTTHTSTSFKHDILNNYFVFGPASTGTDNTWYQIDLNQSIYYSGNLKDSNLNGTLDGATTTPYWYQGTGTVLSSPWSSETTAYPTLDAPSAARAAISRAGTLPRDAMDALIISQIMTLGKGTTGSGAGTVGPDGGLYTSQAETGLPNNGYGSITGGTRPTDTDNDGMPDVWESATGSDPAKDDAMTKAADGYALVERYINWLAEPHATSAAGAAVNVDLAAYGTGFGGAAATYAVAGGQNGAVTLGSDKHTATFQPTAGFKGLGSFTFTVTAADGSKYSDDLVVLVTP
jgi:hypothetical protein